MKKMILMLAVAMVATTGFAQKANVNKAKNEAMKTEGPNFEVAREAITAALANDETKDQANTWYVAGLIGYQENAYALGQVVFGQAKDAKKVGKAVVESYNYWMKAAELSQVEVADKKGNMKPADPKTLKMVATKLLDYYKGQDLVQYGIALNDERDYAGAYEAFMLHLSIPDLPFMQDAKMQKEMPKDTTYQQYQYYAGLFATQSEQHDKAIAVYEQMKNGDYEAITVNQLLYQEYVALKDTVNYVRVLQDAILKFPSEPWFLQNLINHYIFSGQESTAIDYLQQAINREPKVAQYHLIMGNLLENAGRGEEAMNSFAKALELDPKMADAKAGQGRIFYNKAVKMNEEAAYIADAKEYKKALEEANAEFKKSLPYFEEAHKIDPAARDYMMILKTLYYRFEMEKEYEAITKELEL